MTKLEECCVEALNQTVYENATPVETMVINILVEMGLLELEENVTFRDTTYHIVKRVNNI